MHRRAVVSFVVLAVPFLACSAPTVPTVPRATPFNEMMTISALAPVAGTALSRGTTVAVSATVASHVSSPSRLTLLVRDQAGNQVAASAPAVEIAALGEANLQASFVVPSDASRIDVLGEFYIAEHSRPDAVLFLTYTAR